MPRPNKIVSAFSTLVSACLSAIVFSSPHTARHVLIFLLALLLWLRPCIQGGSPHDRDRRNAVVPPPRADALPRWTVRIRGGPVERGLHLRRAAWPPPLFPGRGDAMRFAAVFMFFWGAILGLEGDYFCVRHGTWARSRRPASIARFHFPSVRIESGRSRRRNDRCASQCMHACVRTVLTLVSAVPGVDDNVVVKGVRRPYGKKGLRHYIHPGQDTGTLLL